MAEPVIRLDRTKTFSECRGERAPDDPHYRVHFQQGQRVGKDMVLLPFDSEGNLVPDDGKTEPFQGLVEGKPVTHYPLYNKAMRDLLELKKRRGKAAQATGEEPVDENPDDETNLADEVNFVSWLKGDAKYEWSLLQVAAKQRFSRVFTSKKEMVVDLVMDEKIVPEAELSAEFFKLLPERAAA